MFWALTAIASQPNLNLVPEDLVVQRSNTIVVATPGEPFMVSKVVDGVTRVDQRWVVKRTLCGELAPGSEILVQPAEHAAWASSAAYTRRTGIHESVRVELFKTQPPVPENVAAGALLFLTGGRETWTYAVSNAWAEVPSRRQARKLGAHCRENQLPVR